MVDAGVVRAVQIASAKCPADLKTVLRVAVELPGPR